MSGIVVWCTMYGGYCVLSSGGMLRLNTKRGGKVRLLAPTGRPGEEHCWFWPLFVLRMVLAVVVVVVVVVVVSVSVLVLVLLLLVA